MGSIELTGRREGLQSSLDHGRFDVCVEEAAIDLTCYIASLDQQAGQRASSSGRWVVGAGPFRFSWPRSSGFAITRFEIIEAISHIPL
jgi:hypothetical protein